MGIEFIEFLQNVTTSNYNAIANSHTLQFTAARTESFVCRVFTSRCLVTASNAVASSVFVFSPSLGGDGLLTKLWTSPACNTSARTA
jgi:hypothetical protein